MNPAFSVFTKFAVIACISWMVCLVQIDIRNADHLPSNSIENSSMDTPWRLTEFGWQNSNQWQHRATTAPWVTRIHPFVWTAGILLAVLGLMVWSSSEVEMDSLTDPKLLKRQKKSRFPEIKPTHCKGCGKCENFCREDFLNGY